MLLWLLATELPTPLTWAVIWASVFSFQSHVGSVSYSMLPCHTPREKLQHGPLLLVSLHRPLCLWSLRLSELGVPCLIFTWPQVFSVMLDLFLTVSTLALINDDFGFTHVTHP